MPVSDHRFGVLAVAPTAPRTAGFTVSLIRVVPLKGIMLGGYSVLKDWVKVFVLIND